MLLKSEETFVNDMTWTVRHSRYPRNIDQSKMLAPWIQNEKRHHTRFCQQNESKVSILEKVQQRSRQHCKATLKEKVWPEIHKQLECTSIMISKRFDIGTDIQTSISKFQVLQLGYPKGFFWQFELLYQTSGSAAGDTIKVMPSISSGILYTCTGFGKWYIPVRTSGSTCWYMTPMTVLEFHICTRQYIPVHTSSHCTHF